MISADPADRPELPSYRILLESGLLIVENLCGLHQLSAGDADLEFFCQPLRIRDADGSPVRAFVRSRGDAG